MTQSSDVELLKAGKCFRYRGKKPHYYYYLVAYDHNAGRTNRYTVLKWGLTNIAKVIGRELPLDTVKSVIARHESGEL